MYILYKLLGSEQKVIRDFISEISQETANYFLIEARAKYICSEIDNAIIPRSLFDNFFISSMNIIQQPASTKRTFTLSITLCVERSMGRNVSRADYDEVSHYQYRCPLPKQTPANTELGLRTVYFNP